MLCLNALGSTQVVCHLAGMDKYSEFAGLGFQMIAVIGIFTWAGYWLDGYMGNAFPAFTVALAVTAVLLSLYNVIRKLPKDN
jgi:ATP synthase protein I